MQSSEKMENIINEFINSDVIIIFLAFLNNILTALIKLPIKKLSTNKKITRFIPLKPHKSLDFYVFLWLEIWLQKDLVTT